MTPQTSIAHYRVTSKLGEGGMGQVWRATDTKLNREVAIKVLPDTFADDPDRMARFRREAQVLASLNHPNIAAVYGVEERAIVLELVDGPTLAERIAQGPIPLEEALGIARQIGEALEAAHAAGVVHRDLKPANIKLTADGRVKVLDFGLAKAMSGDPLSGDPASSPTLTIRATTAGMIIGTAAYMSPEQAKGKTVDKRADIWAFGAILFEMLAGRQLFGGETVSDILASVLTKEPEWGRAPAQVRPLLRSALEKDPNRRLRDIGDAWRLIGEASSASATERRRPIAWMCATAALAVIATTLAAVHYTERPAPTPLMKFAIPAPDKTMYNAWLALSPDGRQLAFPATGNDGVIRIWVRPLDSTQARSIAVGDGSSTVTAFWSPDSRFVVFQTGGKLKKVAIEGGPPQSLCDAPRVMLGGSWNAAGVMLFGSNSGPIMRLSPAGGTPTPVTELNRALGDTYHSDPILLPDGKHFLYFRHSSKPGEQGVRVGSLEAKPGEQSRKTIALTDFSPGYAPPPPGGSVGQLLYLREESLVAQPFDQKRLDVAGEAVPVVDHVGTSMSRATFSVSPDGTMVYRDGAGPAQEMSWYDRDGRPAPRGGALPVYDVALSPDGTRIAYSRVLQGGMAQIWILDLDRGADARFTFVPESVRAPVWSRDGRYLAFSASASHKIYIQEVKAGEAVPIFETDATNILNDWSPDGRYLVFTHALNGYDVLALSNPLGGGERKIVPVANSDFSELHGHISPDGRWIAYDSTESGRPEVYVRPFPPDEARKRTWLISMNGGQAPRWRADGRELFYVASDHATMMAASIKTDPVFEAEPPHALFTGPVMNVNDWQTKYAVRPDGKQFLLLTHSASAVSSPATVVLNWRAGLKQ